MAIVFVQSAKNGSESAASISATIAAPGAGNTLVALCHSDSDATNWTMSALTSQAWVKVYPFNGGATQPNTAIFVSTNCGTGTTCTLNLGTTNNCLLVVYEFSGMSNAGTDDGHNNSGTGTGAVTTWTVASTTPTQANDVACTLFAIDATGGTFTAPSGYTVPTNGTQTTTGRELHTAYKIKVDSLAESPAWQRSSSANVGLATMCLFAPAGAAAAPATPTFEPHGMPICV